MKAELEPPGPYQGIALTAETEEEVKCLVNLWLGKARVVSLYNPRENKLRVAKVRITPTVTSTEEE